MSLAPRLDLRQSQALVMTPQLQQAIKLLALSNLELEAVIGEALEANPLLELAAGEDPPAPRERSDPFEPGALPASVEPALADDLIRRGAGEADAPLDLDTSALDRDRDTGDPAAVPDRGDWAAGSGGPAGEDGFAFENVGDQAPTLAAHLEAQLGLVAADPRRVAIARHLIGLLDEAGYLAADLREVAAALGIGRGEAEAGLALLQSLEPTGVGARSLGECLALQAREADRYDPCMEKLIDNLDLVAKGAFAQLRRLCRVDEEDFADMLAELRSYDPRPGLRFSAGGEAAAVVPDILVGPRADGGWDIRINEATLPRLVVNRPYYLELRRGCPGKEGQAWLSDKLADANWLIKALDQRQKTILKVAAQIVTQQDGFFRKGVSELRPLTLAKVADAIGMHESTVSRVTSNKWLSCPRGTFELKYFFTSGVGSADGEGASAEAVKARIRALIEAEPADEVLSDDTLVDLLRAEGFDLARRTVAKYREAIGIGSSVQRRRARKLAAAL